MYVFVRQIKNDCSVDIEFSATLLAICYWEFVYYTCIRVDAVESAPKI